MIEARQTEREQQQRKHHDQRDCKSGKADGADCEEERNEIEPDDAALLLLIVDDIECIKNRLHAGIGAPQRDAETQEKAEGESAVALGCDARNLVAQDVEYTRGNDA